MLPVLVGANFDERGNAKKVEIDSLLGTAFLRNTIKTLKLWRVDPGSPLYVVVPIDYRQKRQTRPKPRANTSQYYQPSVQQTVPPPGGYVPQPDRPPEARPPMQPPEFNIQSR
jgi:hypothetical protein